MTTPSNQSSISASLDHCAACGCQLTGAYYTLLDSDERYCPQCIDTRPRCDSCGAPPGPHYWQLHDGRLQCPRCHRTAVYDSELAKTLFDETVAGVVTQLSLTLNVGVEFRLVDVPTLQSVRSQDLRHTLAGYERVLGLYQRQGRLRVIYMLYGLPRLLFRATVAHEYAHAWQGEQCPLLSDDRLREGFAEWVAYRHLLWLGCMKAAQRMLSGSHPYLPALRYVLELEQQMGIPGVIAYIRKAE